MVLRLNEIEPQWMRGVFALTMAAQRDGLRRLNSSSRRASASARATSSEMALPLSDF